MLLVATYDLLFSETFRSTHDKCDIYAEKYSCLYMTWKFISSMFAPEKEEELGGCIN